MEVEYTRTQDGLLLALARYRREGRPPVILAHGLALNHRVWDFPICSHSLAQYLYQRGYDVWLPCLRGHGDGAVQSGHREWNWNIDDLAIYDVPAIVEKVLNITQKPPFWLGHSMGGILAYMYLQGACYQKRAIGKRYFSHPCGLQVPMAIHGKCALGDSVLRRERHEQIRGVVTIGSPVNMSWSRTPSWRSLFREEFWESNFVFPFLSRSKTLRSYISSKRFLPLATGLSTIDRTHRVPLVGNWLRKALRTPLDKIISSPICSLFWYPPNMNRQLIVSLLTTTLNDVCGRVLDQFADWTAHQTFRAFPRGEEAPYVYSENLRKIETPSLVITGKYDKIANATVVYEQGFSALGGDDKQYICADGFGHNDLCIGLRAPQAIFPRIEQWLRKRAGRRF